MHYTTLINENDKKYMMTGISFFCLSDYMSDKTDKNNIFHNIFSLEHVMIMYLFLHKQNCIFCLNLILSYIREITDLTTKDIRVGMRRFKKMYLLIKNDKIDSDLL